MTRLEKTQFEAALRDAFTRAINCIGLDAFKRTSFFGSNDAAFIKAKRKGD